MKKQSGKQLQDTPTAIYQRIRDILESARAQVARSVNTTQVVANWLIGREIVEEEQKGKKRAEYGSKLLQELSRQLTTEVSKGWSVRNLEYCRTFYLEYPQLMDGQKSNALRAELGESTGTEKSNAVRGEFKRASAKRCRAAIARRKGRCQASSRTYRRLSPRRHSWW